MVWRAATTTILLRAASPTARYKKSVSDEVTGTTALTALTQPHQAVSTTLARGSAREKYFSQYFSYSLLYAQDGNQQPNAEQYKPRSEKREGEQVEARRESSVRRDRKRKMGRHLEMSFSMLNEYV